MLGDLVVLAAFTIAAFFLLGAGLRCVLYPRQIQARYYEVSSSKARVPLLGWLYAMGEHYVRSPVYIVQIRIVGIMAVVSALISGYTSLSFALDKFSDSGPALVGIVLLIASPVGYLTFRKWP